MININEEKKYLEYFKIGFKKSIEYKSYLIGTLITPLFLGTFFYIIWKFIYLNNYHLSISKGLFNGNLNNFTIGGFTFNEMILYLIINLLIANLKVNYLPKNISNIIKSGDIVIYLSKPINFVKSLLYENIGTKVINFFIMSLLLITLTKLLNINFPNLITTILFIIYGLFMILFYNLLFILIGGLSFWLIEIGGIKASFDQIFWILTGKVFPINLFPLWLQSILKYTPFMYLEYTFAKIYLNKFNTIEIIHNLFIFILWIILLLILVNYIYKKGFKKLETFGG
jgi:ABC-2 type transport system permease protein